MVAIAVPVAADLVVAVLEDQEVVPDLQEVVPEDQEVVAVLIIEDMATIPVAMLLPFTVEAEAVDGIGGPIPTIPGGHLCGIPAAHSPAVLQTKSVSKTPQPVTVTVHKVANTPERWKPVHTLQGPHLPVSETRRCPYYTLVDHVHPYDGAAPLL